MKRLFLLLSLVVIMTPHSRAEIVDRVIAVVNDSAITSSDMTNFQKKLKSNGLLDESLLNMYDRKRLLTDNKYLIEFMIDEQAIDSEVKRQSLVAPIEQVEGEIRNIARSKNVDRNQLKAALKNEGIAYSDYQDFIKTSLQRQNLLQKEVTSKIKISDDEVNAYYAAKASAGKALVYEYNLANILFLNSNGGPEKAAERAKEVRAKIAEKLPFESLAARYSEDPQFVQGGYFGTFKLSDFNKDVEAVMRGLNAGDISPVVKMADGYRIFKVNKKTLVPSPDLEAKREDIRRVLMSENFKRQYKGWIEQLRRDSFIKIN